MIREAKSMFAGCIDKMRHQSCGGCERRHDCRFVWPEMLGLLFRPREQAGRSEPAAGRPNRFVSFLGEVARAVESRPRPTGTPLRREVERQIEPLLAHGQVRIEEVARALGYSRQTLYRRLKEEGFTFERILDDLRRRLALWLVREEGLSVKETAYRLGFSDPAAFSRAFKRWTGSSPRGPRPPRDQAG
ncbi:MAG TPA: AraC family transcriptional regulator [Allosphingosinicella sp.]|nr:AraC family transcriptional regulator [Allosphingosinicella sp.]